MLTINKLIAAGRGLAPVLLRQASTVALDWDVRQKSRFDATDSLGRKLGVFLPRGTVVRGGDVLVAEDGSLIRVEAAPQSVMVIRHCSAHGTPFDLTRAAYHLGNRHVPIDLRPDRLQIEPDHVLGEMLQRMHLIVTREDAPFEPESGAYAESHGGHGHDHAHDHAHGRQTQGHAAHHGHDHSHGHGGHVHDHAPDHTASIQVSGRGVPVGIPVVAAHAAVTSASPNTPSEQAHQHGHAHAHSHDHDHGDCGCGHTH